MLTDLLVSLRLAQPQDEWFLFQVYASTRADEMALVPWTAEQKQSFLRMQFNAQRQSYALDYPDAAWQIIVKAEVPIGRLIVDRAADRILLMDLALLPEHRNHGIGTALIRELMAEAQRTGKPLHLHVEPFNPAFKLYERLGFVKVGEAGIYWELAWLPGGDAKRDAA
jgi:ribosomal protein S18 acetylase RimI-like enzyme